ncbi:hypothetical protein Tco_0045190 [Tanacetum coccineum]
MFSVRRFDCFPLSKGDDTFWFGSKTVGMDESLWFVWFARVLVIVDVRTYLLGGVINGSKANGIIRNPKLELESSRFTFDLVPLSYESVDVIVGENWLLRHKAEMVLPCRRRDLYGNCTRSDADLRRLVSFDVFFRKARGVERLQELQGRVMDTLKFTAMPFGLTNAPVVFMELMSLSKEEHESHVKMIVESLKEEKMYVKFSQQRGSGAKRKLSRRGRNQMGNEPILALPEGADDFVVYYDAQSKDLEACLEKWSSEFDFEAKYHLGKANVDVVPWSRKKE